ncbi:hypothetical protein FRC08_005368 [Ceratobasidium sp. 394]|nr:hypothetical protein FRC08_005368 [Ceratobasidium sp. 394]
MHDLQVARRTRREREYKIAGPSNRPHPSSVQPGPSSRQTAPPSNGANGEEGRYNDPRRWTDNGRTCHQPYVERFPVSSAGEPISDERAHPRNLEAYLQSCGNLANRRNMEAAELLMTTGLSGKARTRHLQSSFYQNPGHDYEHCCCKGKGKAKAVPWQNDRQMLRDIDLLPHGPDWHAQELVAGEGRYERSHTLYKRSVVDVVRELIGNPAFKRVMRYAPERHWTSRACASRVYSEMWTGDWWWRRQLFLHDRRGTIAPLIIASDKTKMTKLSGNKSAYPVYLTIGNISKTYRRQATKHATVVIGYLPIDDFKDVPNKALRTRLKGELVHAAMASLMEPLEQAGREGVDMWCADGRLRRVYPLLAAFVGDWPEQCDMGCVVRSGCPKCLKRKGGRGDERKAAARTRRSTLLAIERYLETGRKAALAGLGLKPWWPWWGNLPGADFATCVTPDLLHQLHKGLFKGHAMRWIQRKLGEKVVDERYTSMPRASGLHHFKRGISTVEQWTGRETKEMMKTFLPLIAEDRSIHSDLSAFIRALLDFSYIAHAARLTEAELGELEGAHAEMHRLKRVLVRSGVYERLGRLDKIPKWHMISHYADSIRELGTPDGYNTEAPEYLHIVYVKRGWAASNKREATQQIITYCQRLEALRIHRAHLDEFYGPQEGRGEPEKMAVFIDDDEEDIEYWPEERKKGNDQPPEGAEAEENEEDWEDIEDWVDDEDEEGERRQDGPRWLSLGMFTVPRHSNRRLGVFFVPTPAVVVVTLSSLTNSSTSGTNSRFTIIRCLSPPTNRRSAT